MEKIIALFKKRKRVEHAKEKVVLTMPPVGKEVLTAEEVAAYTGHTVGYVYKLCSTRRIPHYNSEEGRKVYFKLSEIIQWCTARKVKTTNEILNNQINRI